ncbi:tetratricopeptide repeat protein [Candidatus Poribacteria bacterium]|nr:tetratricopeptide repeat protein [Candidatus Poribacteria bacterium]
MQKTSERKLCLLKDWNNWKCWYYLIFTHMQRWLRMKCARICCWIYLLLCLFFVLSLTSYTRAQEVTVTMADGDRVTGTLLEYINGILKLRTQHGTLRIAAKELARVDFGSKAYVHLVNAQQLMEMEMEEEALAEIKLAVREAPKFAEAYYELSKYWQKKGNMEEALKYFGISLDLGLAKPGMAKDLMDLADNYYRKDDLKSAAETYYLLFLYFPNNIAAEDAAYRSGFLFAEELEDNQKALSSLERAVAAFPESQYAQRGLYEIGRIYVEEDSPEAAESALLQLLSTYPDGEWSDNASYILARAYRKQRRNQEAIQQIIKVLSGSDDEMLINSAKQILDECAWTVFTVNDGLPNNYINALAKFEDDVWIGTSSGAIKYNLEAQTFIGEVLLRGIEVRSIAVDGYDLWIGTQDSGIVRYDMMKDKWITYTENDGLTNDRAFAISMDSSNIWIGTAMGGVLRFNRHNESWSSYGMSHGLTSENILSVAATTNGIWCGTLKKGACFFDAPTGKWQLDPAMTGGKSVTSIASGANNVWFAWYEQLRNGISKYDAQKKKWEHWTVAEWGEYSRAAKDSNSVLINLDANNREMWVGADAGVWYYDHLTESLPSSPFEYPPELSGHVSNCVLTDENVIWFGTPNGLGMLDRGLIQQIEQIRQEYQ